MAILQFIVALFAVSGGLLTFVGGAFLGFTGNVFLGEIANITRNRVPDSGLDFVSYRLGLLDG